MDHREAHELLENAAVEPEGFERLIAGDTSEAAALAGHLAGCRDCSIAMERLRADSDAIRSAVRSIPPADLRDRTLAFVAAVGRDRTPAPVTGPALPSTATPLPAIVPKTAIGAGNGAPAGTMRAGGRRQLVGLWAAGAAAVLLAVVGTALVIGGSRDAVIEGQANQIAALSRIATYSLRIDGQPDATHVDLAARDGSDATASLLYSPSSGQLVILAEDLPPAPSGLEYRCWVEVDGQRTRIGRMFPAGEIAFWVGEVPSLPGSGESARFGVTLAPIEGDSVDGEPVLEGEI